MASDYGIAMVTGQTNKLWSATHD